MAVQGLGCRLVIAKSGTVSIPNLELTGDGANIGSLCVREGCTVDFTGEINCRWRLRPFIEKSAKVRFAGCDAAGFKNRFTGSAGFEWDPGADKTFTLSNAVSTTIGEFSVKSGTLMVKDSASFTRLGTLSVAEGAKFVAEAAGAACYATNVLLGSNAELTLGKDRLLRCAYAEVGGVALPAGIYTAAFREVKIGGEGKLVVVPRGKSWKGGDAGDWSDPCNWEGGVPQEGCTFAGTFDVSGGTNVFARVGHPTTERPAAFGAAGTVKFGQIVPPVGMQVIMR